MKDECRIDRREFIKSIGRKAIATAIVVGTGKLVVRKPADRRQSCTGDGICTRCATLTGCGLPQALSAKRERGE